MKAINRRNFLRTGAISAAGLSLAASAKANSLLNTSNRSDVISRKLGNTGIELPVLSMGVGKCDSPAVVKAALKLGVRHFDTAHRYQQGNSEKMLGEVLKDYSREDFVIATKVKATDTKEQFLEKFEESLTRLQMDHVDILYLHAVSTVDQLMNEEMVAALKQVKKDGKAKHIGVSTHKNEPEIIQGAIDSDLYEIVLCAINFKQDHKEALREKINLAAEKGIGIVAMKVMAGGFLDKEKQEPVNFTAALKWPLQNEGVATTIPSMVNLEQLMNNSAILNDISLDSKEKEDLAVAQNAQGLYCNACKECVSTCKNQLAIPELMRAYMYCYGYSEAKKAKELLSSLNTPSKSCEECDTCTAHCPKGFKIAEKIKDISRLENTPSEFLT